MKNKSIQVRVDPNLKKNLEKILAKIGIDMPTAVRIFFSKVVMTEGIPFPLTTHLEDNYTPAQIRKLDKLAEQALKSKKLRGPFTSADDLIQDLRRKS